MTDVMDLSTGTVYSYNAKPKEALIMCFEQISKGNYNTWNYNFEQQITESKLCYSIGDLATFKNGRAYTTSTTNKKAGPTIAIGLANKGG